MCVAKSLISSKIIHVLQSLPSPPMTYLKQIETLLINFVWKDKCHELSKKALYLNCDMGGLNMIDIVEFDFSLKLTWVRKTLMGHSEWINFALENKIDRLVKTGENYHQELYLTIQNPLWKGVVMAYKKWSISLNSTHTTVIENEFLWGNPKIKIPFNNPLFKLHIIYVKDLYNHEGLPITLPELKRITGKNMFTTYFAIWKALPFTYYQFKAN